MDLDDFVDDLLFESDLLCELYHYSCAIRSKLNPEGDAE